MMARISRVIPRAGGLARHLQQDCHNPLAAFLFRKGKTVILTAALVSKFRPIASASLAALSGFLLLISPGAVSARSGDHASYVLLDEGSQSTTMSGSTDDLDRALALRTGKEALLYVRQGGRAYVIRDAATLRRAHSIFEPQRVLGDRQSELGARQAELGGRQAALGAEQARIGALQASASPRRAEELARQQDDLGRRQDAFGRQQDELGQQQDALGREQDRLGREAEAKFDTLLADAIKSGVAQPVR
jgi:hypothetical protein